MKTILVFGASGMLGHSVCQVLVKSGFEVVSTVRPSSSLPDRRPRNTVTFDVETDEPADVIERLAQCVGVVNAIGVIKPHIDEANPESMERAIRVNALFPFALARAAEEHQVPVIQIATDCVYSGSRGAYVESDKHDALDVYGKTKSLGEVSSENVLHLRASIVGRELGRRTSLVEWVLGQQSGATINGFVNHQWNGVTTHAFGRVCAGILSSRVQRHGHLHLTPTNQVSKYELLVEIASRFGRTDLQVVPTEAPESIDRTLRTLFPDDIAELWRAAGYHRPPTVAEMIARCP